MKKEYEYKRIVLGAKTHAKTLMYLTNKQGLRGWELYTRFMGQKQLVFHFRKRKTFNHGK